MSHTCLLLAYAERGTSSSVALGGIVQEETGSIYSQIEQSEYEIRWQESAGAYMAPNRANNLRFTFYEDGVSATPRQPSNNQVLWAAKVRLESFGRPGLSANRVGAASWSFDKTRLKVQNEALCIDYRNDKGGLRQDFLIRECEPGAGPLQLNFVIERSNVIVTVDPAENLVYFRNLKNETVLQYCDLNVFDADHRPLAARMVQVDSDHFAIVVEDQAARYPVLVDPSFISDGTLSSSGLFGYSVAYIMYYQNSTERPIEPPVGGPNIGGVLVGAPYFDSGSLTNAGKVFFYDTEGGGLPSTPTWSYVGTEANEYLGWSVADGGANKTFLNFGSTYHNILVGAPGYEGIHSDAGGAALAFYPTNAGSNYGTTPSWMVTGADSSSGNFGWSVAGNVDFNQDGYGDIIVGAPNSDIADIRFGGTSSSPSLGTSGQGAAYIFYGTGTGYSTISGWSQTGGSGSDFGFSVDWGLVQGLVSVDSGKYPAVLVGAPGTNSSHGAVYEYLNSTGTPDTIPDLVLQGQNSGDEFGYAIGSREDQNDDSYQDLLVGAPNATYSSMAGAGKVYLYRGNTNGSGLSSSYIWSLGGDSTNSNLGVSVALGDMTTNNYADVIIGEPNMSSTNAGTKYIEDGYVQFYLTDTTATNNNLPVYSLTLVGYAPYYNLGASVAYGSQLVNNHEDIIVGAPGTNSVITLRWSP